MSNLAQGIAEKHEAIGEKRGTIKAIIQLCQQMDITEEGIVDRIADMQKISHEEAQRLYELYK